MKQKNKKAFVLTLVTVITLVLAVVGASFAYFTAQTGAGASSNATVTTKTTDSLTFIGGSPIGITATQDNFGSGKPNLSSETIAKARLIANTGNNTATYNYFVYLDITANDFEYISATTPELILTVTDPSGSEVKSINGLTYVTSGAVTGFDVTTAKGLIRIAENKELTTTTTKEEDWKVKLTFVNLTSDQQKNTGKTFVGKLKIQKEVVPPTFAETLIANNGTIGMDHHTATLANGANDGNYRYSGANPNNYVCFGPGTTAAGQTCLEENQYRIIGVFGNQVKLIKKTSVGNRQWDNKGESGDNTWSTSLIKTYLNGEYLNNLTSTWSNKITSNTWQVGGMSDNYGRSAMPAKTYNYESGPNKANVTFNGKIGLMYLSDYGFAVSSQAWTTIFVRYNEVTANNWLFAGSIHGDEWTISRMTDYNYRVFSIFDTGEVYYDYNFCDYSNAVRPSFYLESSINLIGGNGTAIDPYRI